MKLWKLLLVCGVLCVPQLSWADSIRITSGTMTEDYDSGGSLTLSGPDGSVSGGGVGSLSVFALPVNMTYPSWRDSFSFGFAGIPGSITAGGRTYTGNPTASVNFTSSSPFMSGDFTGIHTFSVPGTFAGTETLTDPTTSAVIASVSFIGSAIETFALSREADLYIGGGASYAVIDAASPTPEPASLVLLVSGLGGLAFRRRAGRRAQ